MKKAPSPARAGVIPWGPWLRKGGAEVQTPSLFLTWDVCAPGSAAAGLCLECTPPAPGSQASGLDGPHRQPSWAPSSPQQWRECASQALWSVASYLCCRRVACWFRVPGEADALHSGRVFLAP